MVDTLQSSAGPGGGQPGPSPSVRQQVGRTQPSLPSPLSPSKKQSCRTGSMLSPGMPVAKLSSRSSSGPLHWISAPSMKSSPSSSSQLLHCGPSAVQSPPPPPPPPPSPPPPPPPSFPALSPSPPPPSSSPPHAAVPSVRARTVMKR